MKRLAAILACTLLPLGDALGAGFDHGHRAWTELLRQHVVVIDGGSGSQVRYADIKNQRTELKAYLDTVTRPAFEAWTKENPKTPDLALHLVLRAFAPPGFHQADTQPNKSTPDPCLFNGR